jgi:hypothetical protein
MRFQTLFTTVVLVALAAFPGPAAARDDHRKMLGFFDNLFGKTSPSPPTNDPALDGNPGFPLVAPIVNPEVISSASAGDGGASASTSASIVINGDGNTVTQTAGSTAVVEDTGSVIGDGPTPPTSPSPSPSPSPVPSQKSPSPSPRTSPAPAPSPGPGGSWWSIDATYGQPEWDVMEGADASGADLVGCDGKPMKTDQPDNDRCKDYCLSLRTCYAVTFDGKTCYPKMEHGYSILRASPNFVSSFYTGPTATEYAPKPSGCTRAANYFPL